MIPPKSAALHLVAITLSLILVACSGGGSSGTVSAPQITSLGTASGTVGQAFSYQITATNSPTSYGATGLPAGLSVNASGLISGTPTAAGTSNVTISATNSGGTGNATLVLTVAAAVQPPAITSSGTATGTVGSAFSYQITATNTPTSYNATGLPSGLTVNTSSGLISGTPAAAGSSTITISATNSGGTGNATLVLTVAAAVQPPVITSSGTATGTAGNAFSYQITATNTPTSYNATGLPSGLTVNTTSGLISGTPSAAGTSTVSLSATNSGGTGNATLTLTVTLPAPVITSSSTASGTVGTGFTYQITATNSPASYGATGLPAGLAVNPTSGLISGIPAAVGVSSVTISATNSGGTGNATLTLTVNAVAPVITSSGTADGTVGVSFTYQIMATNSPTSYGATGLPAGLTVNMSSGLISGTPTAAGTSSVTISATNSGGTGNTTLTLTVNSAVQTPVITSSGTASGTVGTGFSYQITATNLPTSYGATGLPAGLAVNTSSGLISGTPTAAGTSNATISATNSGGTGSAPLAVTISLGTGSLVTHTVQISNDADDGYYNNEDGSGWHSTPQFGAADLVGSYSGTTTAWATGYRFPSVEVNSGDTIQSAYLQLVSSDSFATSSPCGSVPTTPCTNNYTFRVYGVAEDDGLLPFSNTPGNTPLDVPYTSTYTDYTTTGPGDAHGGCQGNNNGQNTCTHIIDVTNMVREITSRPGWTKTSAMRFVMESTDSLAPNVYAGYEDFSGNATRAATLVVNPPLPAIVSSGGWGTSPSTSYPTTYNLGPFVYPGASTLLLFLADYHTFPNVPTNSVPIPQPTLSDSCGNIWNILAGPTNWQGFNYDMRSTVYYVQNPVSCPAGTTITVANGTNQEPIYLHFLAVTGTSISGAPIVSAITNPASPGTTSASATSDTISLTKAGLLVSWIRGDSDISTSFTPQLGFIADLNSIPTYITGAFLNVSSPGSYNSQFSISPADGYQIVIVGLQVP